MVDVCAGQVHYYISYNAINSSFQHKAIKSL